MNLRDKVVLITGGSAGIGAASVILFAKEGAKVAFIGRNETKLKAVAEICEQIGATVLPIRADISQDDELKEALQKTIDAFGKLDVLVNNAGIFRKIGLLDENYMETFDAIIRTNLRSVAFLTRISAPYLIKTKGNIVNISSVSSTTAHVPNYSAYKVSKAALDHFTRCTALELAPQGIRVNSVNPGPVDTDIFVAAGMPGALESFAEKTALGRASDSEEIADLILYLASDKAKSITGAIYLIDNGRSLT